MYRDKRRTFPVPLVLLLTPLTFLALYGARALDDNRLSSWQWCFQERRVWAVLFAIAAGCILSYYVTAFSVRIRNRAAFLFLASFLSASFFWSEPEVIVDAARYFTQAKYLELYGIKYFLKEWGVGIGAWTDMPATPFLYGLVFRFLGEARIYVQILNTAFFSLSTVLSYLIGRELWDEDTGFYGGLMLLGMPYLYTQVPLLLVDIATMFFFLLAVYTFVRALKKGGVMIVISAIAIFLAFFSKYSAWLMLSVLPVAAVVRFARERSRPEAARRKHILIARTLYIVLIAALLIGPVMIYKLGVFSGQIKLLMAYQKPGLRRWGESFISTFFFQIHPFISLAALYSVYAAFKRRDLKYVVVAWLVALVILMQIKRIRYIIMVLPMLSLAASYGFCGIKGAHLRRVFAACIVTSSLSIALFAYLPFMESHSAMNLKEAGKFLDSLPERNVEVFTPTPTEPVLNPAVAVPLLDYFTQKKIIYNGGGSISPEDREKIENSSLRFTLDYQSPFYYEGRGHADGDAALVVISESTNDPLPSGIQKRTAGYRKIAAFERYEGIFRYRTSISIYKKEAHKIGASD